MHIDTGLVIVIGAVLIFYLRLIILQRQRAKQALQARALAAQKSKKGKAQPPAPPRYSVLSPNKYDRIVGGVGALSIMVGVLLNAGLLPFPAAQPYWWIPTAVGIVAFSWAFKL
jgi:hypothetical protein